MLAGLYATGARKVPAVRRSGSCRRGGRGYLEPRPRPATRRRTGTTGSCACCSGCATGCAPVTCSCRARAVTPTRRRSCSPPSSGSRSGPSSASWSGSPRTAADALAQADDELHTALASWRAAGEGQPGPGPAHRRRGAGHPAADRRGRARPRPTRCAPSWPRCCRGCRSPRCWWRSTPGPGSPTTSCTPAGRSAGRPELKRNLMYVIIAEATNMGLGAMAESCGVPYDVLAWTAEWYFRPGDPGSGERRDRQLPPPAAADAGVRVRHPVVLGRAAVPGQGQVHHRAAPVAVLRPRAGHLHLHPRLGPALHLRHQGHRGDRPGVALRARRHPGQRDGPADHEHATDTHGATLANFALFDLVGKQLSPRIRDLGKITLYRTGGRADFEARYPRAGALLTRRLNTDLITGMWDDLLRVAASVKGGHATAALVVGKLCSSKRQQNTLAAAIKEYGALRRTLYAARYLADETYRRRIARQLNKGENLHALRRSLAYAGEGALRRRHHEQQRRLRSGVRRAPRRPRRRSRRGRRPAAGRRT